MEFKERSVLMPIPGIELPEGARLWEAETQDGGTLRVGVSQAPNGVRFVQIGYVAKLIGEDSAFEVRVPVGERYPTVEEIEAALAVALEPHVVVSLGLISGDKREAHAGVARVLMFTEVGRTDAWRSPNLVMT